MIYHSLSELFQGICDAIRVRDGTSDKISHQDIPDRIVSIQGGESNYFEFPEGYTVACIESPFIMLAPEEITVIEEGQV